MKSSVVDEQTIQALLERLNTWRLPRALRLKERVDHGEKLGEHDIAFLNRVFEDSQNASSMAAKHPELQSLVSRLTDLYSHITRKALENEKAS